MNDARRNAIADRLANMHLLRIRVQTDRMFGALMVLQFVAALAAALLISPRTWHGATSAVHVHVLAAAFIGSILAGVPLWLILRRPGAVLTRHVVAVAQVLFSALFIHLTGGRIETHFHVFGSLAFLAFYRDWRVLVPATAVVAVDHLARGIFWPESVFGVVAAAPWRALEHAGWVLFEDICLVYSCVCGVKQVRLMATRQARLKVVKESFERTVEERTAQLAQSESFLRSVLDGQSAQIIIMTRDARIEWVNRSFVRTSGFDLTEVAGRDALPFLHGPDTSPRTIGVMHHGLSSGLGFDIETQDHADTGDRWIDLEVRPILSGDGHVERFIAIKRDITDSKQRNQRLRLLHAAVENARDAMLTFTENGRLVDVNPAACSSLGYTRAELLELHVWDLFPEISSRAWPARWNALIRDGQATVQSEFRTNDDRRLPVAVSKYLVQHEGVKYGCAVVRDVSEQVEMETRLRRERSLLREILATIPYLVFWKDLDSRFLGCNRAFTKDAGFSSPAQIVGKTDFDLPWGAEKARRNQEAEAQVMASGVPMLHVEETERCADGSMKTLVKSRVPLRNETGEVVGLLGVFADVTQRKQLESQLVHAQKLESIGQLAAGIAHEINTPAQYVSDNTRFLRDEFDGLMRVLDAYGELLDPAAPALPWAERAEKTRTILESVDFDFLRQEIPQALEQSLDGIERVATIVRAMKEFSHPGSQMMQPADLNQSIDSTITVCRNRWKYTADLDLDLDPDLPPVPCLLAAFNQVILNLVVNAADAIEERYRGMNQQGRIRISTRQVEGMAEIRVSDDGGGIPDAIRAKVFDPFFTTKQVGRGTGQGLAISHDVIVHKHGGSLRIETEPGEGTTFIIRIPIDRTTERTAA